MEDRAEDRRRAAKQDFLFRPLRDCSLQEGSLQEGSLRERFDFREIRPDEADQAAMIEQICFEPDEACTEVMMRDRVQAAPELFLVAVDREKGSIAGFLNGIATDEGEFRDAFFSDASLHRPEGKNVMLLGLDVLPQYRRQGLARELMSRYLHREAKRGRELVLLTCAEDKIEMYEKMGFQNKGISPSAWGGGQWYDMVYLLKMD